MKREEIIKVINKIYEEWLIDGSSKQTLGEVIADELQTKALSQLKKKLLSMRLTREQMKSCDQEGTFIAYGWTDCLNTLLIWIADLQKVQDGIGNKLNK